MKKIFLTALVISMIAFVSCKKDSSSSSGGGVVTPDEPQTVAAKLSEVWEEKITYQEMSTDNGHTWTVTETTYDDKEKIYAFTWSGDNLSKIRDYSSEGTNYDFFYENNKLSQVLAGETRLDVTYTDSHISMIRGYYDGENYGNYYTTYSGDKLKKIDVLYDDGTEEIEFFWNDDNVSVMTIDDWASRFDSYDNGNNPYYGYDAMMFFIVPECEEYSCLLSKNNCTEIDFGEGLITFQYSYNSNNYPTKVVRNWTFLSDNYVTYMTRKRTVTTYTIEYVN